MAADGTDGTICGEPARRAVVLRPDHHYGDAARRVLRGRDDELSVSRGIRIFDYPHFAEPLRDRIREPAQEVATPAGANRARQQGHIRKEDLVARVLGPWGSSGIGACDLRHGSLRRYKPWHDKSNGQTFLRHDHGQVPALLLLLHRRRARTVLPARADLGAVPACSSTAMATARLARSLTARGIDFAQADNAFLRVADWAGRSNWPTPSRRSVHRRLDRYAHCAARWPMCSDRPVTGASAGRVLDRSGVPQRARSSSRCMTPSRARRCWPPMRRGWPASWARRSRRSWRRRSARGCPRASRAAASSTTLARLGVKVYDKFSRVLRVETTVNDVSFFKHHRKVEHRDGHEHARIGAAEEVDLQPDRPARDPAGLQPALPGIPVQPGRPHAGERDLQRLSQPRVGTDPSVKGLNFFDATDQTLLRTLQHGEFNIHGWRRADLVASLHIAPSAMSRQLRRLHLLGLIKKVTHTPTATTSPEWAAPSSLRLARSLDSASFPPWLLRIEVFAKNIKTHPSRD